MPAADDGWRVLQLAELLRAIERRQDRLLRVLDDVEPAMRSTFALTLRRAQVEQLRRDVAAIAQLADRADAIGEALAEEPLTIAYDDVRISAEHVVSRSITLDPATVLLAARLLDRPVGLRALAEGLRSSDACTTWKTTTVGGLVGAFRGVSPQLARRIVTNAGLAPGADISDCRPDEIAQLAEQLDLHVTG